jgi:hypothetical protein
MQSYYASGLDAFLGSIKPTAPMLIGGCEIISGSLAAGGVIANGIAYHPTYGLMLIKGGTFNANAGITVVSQTNNLVFDGNVPRPAETEKYISINNSTTTSEFVAMVNNKWYLALAAHNSSLSTWTEVFNGADAQLYVHVNMFSRTVYLSGYGKWSYYNPSGQYSNRTLAADGFTNTSPFILIPAGLRPLTDIKVYASVQNAYTGPWNTNPQLYKRTSGEVFDGAFVCFTTGGHIRIVGYPLELDARPILYFNVQYSF